jgi:selenocysteine lyase/cysteine desulfurase
MTAVTLPECDGEELQRRLYDEHAIEVPISHRHDPPILRASFQAYNDEADLDSLVGALRRELQLVSAA